MMNDDLISRKEAIDAIQTMTISLGGEDIFHPEAKKSVLSVLDDLSAVDAEPVQLRIDVVDVNADKGWYTKLFYCPCGQLIKTETWSETYCFGSGTVLKRNVMPEHCPNCGAKIDLEQ